MKRQTRRNRYEKQRPIQLPKERPVQPRNKPTIRPTNKPTIVDKWFAEWYLNHRTQEQLVEMQKWQKSFYFQMPPEQASQYRRDCIEISASSPNTNIEKWFYWNNAFIASLSDEQRSTVKTWLYQWFNDNQPNSSVDV